MFFAPRLVAPRRHGLDKHFKDCSLFVLAVMVRDGKSKSPNYHHDLLIGFEYTRRSAANIAMDDTQHDIGNTSLYVV
jgi:hypothetical protein